MNYADQLRKDLCLARAPHVFVRHLYRTLFEGNNNFPMTRKYGGVMQSAEKQAFFDVYLAFLESRQIEYCGTTRFVSENQRFGGTLRRVKKAAFMRGIDVSLNPLTIGRRKNIDGLVED